MDTPSASLRRLLLRSGSLMFGIVIAGIVFQLLAFSVNQDGNDLDHQREFNENYRIFSLTLPKDLTFCGEQVPLGRLDVRERLDRELLVNTYWQSNSLLALKRANRWFPIMEPILERNGIPDDMKYLALIESGLTNAVSPLGATGYWQFMKETGIQHGLEVNSEVDERYHVIKSTEAACVYLKAAYEKFGTWSMAAASYNMGVGGLNKQIGRQGADDYYSLMLSDETSRYVFRILAMKEILQDPDRYGFHVRKQDLYPAYITRTVTITGPVEDLGAFAARQGTDYRTLKLLNPWLRDARLTNREGRTYEILLPAEGFDSANTSED